MNQCILAAVLLISVAAVPSVAHAKCSDPPRPRVNWRGCDLPNANLTGASLEGANLQGTNLTGARLMGANLVHANLTGANLVNANLQGANLSCVIFTGAILSDARWNSGGMCDHDDSIGRCKIVYARKVVGIMALGARLIRSVMPIENWTGRTSITIRFSRMRAPLHSLSSS